MQANRKHQWHFAKKIVDKVALLRYDDVSRVIYVAL